MSPPIAAGLIVIITIAGVLLGALLRRRAAAAGKPLPTLPRWVIVVLLCGCVICFVALALGFLVLAL